jgi:hypothetical protein
MAASAQPALERNTTVAALLTNENAIQNLTKSGATMLGLSYALGLAVTNLYLMQLGDCDYSLLKVRSIFTGMIVLLLGAGGIVTLLCLKMSGAIQIVGASLSLSVPAKRFWKQWFLSFIAGILWTFTVALVFLFFKSTKPVWYAVGVVYLCDVAITVLLLIAIKDFGSSHYLRRIAVFCGVLALSLISLKCFASRIYPNIFENMGGGHWKYEKLLATPEGTTYLQLLGYVFDNKTCTAEVKVLYENDDHVVIMPQSTGPNFEQQDIYMLDRKLIPIRIYNAAENGPHTLHATTTYSWDTNPCSTAGPSKSENTQRGGSKYFGERAK